MSYVRVKEFILSNFFWNPGKVPCFVKCFFGVSWNFFSTFICWCIINSFYVASFLHSWVEFNLVKMYNLSMWYLIQFAISCWDFCNYNLQTILVCIFQTILVCIFQAMPFFFFFSMKVLLVSWSEFRKCFFLIAY